MKKIIKAGLFSLAFFCFISSGNAQFYLGVKGGVTIPNLTAGGTNPVSSGWSSRLGPYFGITGEDDLSKKFSIQVELNYASEGGKKNGEQGIPSSQFSSSFPPGTPANLIPQYLYANFKSIAKLNYLELPILAKLSFPLNNNLSFFVDAGPYFGYLMSAKEIASGSSLVYADEAEMFPLTTSPKSFDSTGNITSQINRFNVGVQGGIGLSLKAGAGKLLLSIGGNYGFLNVQKFSEDGKNDTGAATVTLGYAVKI